MRKKHLNFLIIPDDSSKKISFGLSYWKVWVILGLLGFWVLLLIVLTLLYGRAVSDLVAGKSLRQENERLKEYNAKVVELEKELQEYRRFTQRVAELAGIKYPPKTETSLAFAERTEPEGEILEEKTIPSTQGRYLSFSENIENRSAVSSQHGSELSKRSRPKRAENAEIAPGSNKHIPRGKPIDGWISRGFSLGEDVSGKEHTGIDFAAKEGTKVRVTAEGKVSFVGWDDVYGNLAVVNHGNGYFTYYGHNFKILVKPGDFVKRGKVIALSGNSGKSSAPHLHYEIRKDDVPVDPKDFLNPK